MPIEMINIGDSANDGTGDTLRAAFEKVNTSFVDIEMRLMDLETGAGGLTNANLRYNQTVWVDQTYGDDATGERNSPTLPFATLTAAINAAENRDVIFLTAGDYGAITFRDSLDKTLYIVGNNVDDAGFPTAVLQNVVLESSAESGVQLYFSGIHFRTNSPTAPALDVVETLSETYFINCAFSALFSTSNTIEISGSVGDLYFNNIWINGNIVNDGSNRLYFDTFKRFPDSQGIIGEAQADVTPPNFINTYIGDENPVFQFKRCDGNAAVPSINMNGKGRAVIINADFMGNVSTTDPTTIQYPNLAGNYLARGDIIVEIRNSFIGRGPNTPSSVSFANNVVYSISNCYLTEGNLTTGANAVRLSEYAGDTDGVVQFIWYTEE